MKRNNSEKQKPIAGIFPTKIKCDKLIYSSSVVPNYSKIPMGLLLLNFLTRTKENT